MKVRWSPAANRDLNALWSYLHERNPRAAVRVVGRIQTASKLLGERQRAGRTGREPDTRELVVTRTPYLLVYELQQDGPLILRVLHGKQQWPPLEQ